MIVVFVVLLLLLVLLMPVSVLVFLVLFSGDKWQRHFDQQRYDPTILTERLIELRYIRIRICIRILNIAS